MKKTSIINAGGEKNEGSPALIRVYTKYTLRLVRGERKKRSPRLFRLLHSNSCERGAGEREEGVKPLKGVKFMKQTSPPLKKLPYVCVLL